MKTLFKVVLVISLIHLSSSQFSPDTYVIFPAGYLNTPLKDKQPIVMYVFLKTTKLGKDGEVLTYMDIKNAVNLPVVRLNQHIDLTKPVVVELIVKNQ